MVGFGGGSSYLAVLVLAGFPYQNIPPVALICNLIVSASGFYHFCKGGYFEPKKILPFIVLSVPMAYWGGRAPIHKEPFFILLGLSLLAAALIILFPGKAFKTIRDVSDSEAWKIGLPVGGALGFVSGLVGIGGGIFLSPLLLLMRWVDVKQSAAGASFFIFLNSLAGLAGQHQKGSVDAGFLPPLVLAVFLGGQIGARLGATRFPKWGLERILAGLILYASAKLLWGAL